MAAEDCVKGLIIGGLIGVVLGILYAPKAGQETRGDICASTGELLEKAKQQYEQAKDKLEKLAEREKEIALAKKEQLKRALDAGIDAYKGEASQAPKA